jgi:hypothetical protein
MGAGRAMAPAIRVFRALPSWCELARAAHAGSSCLRVSVPSSAMTDMLNRRKQR